MGDKNLQRKDFLKKIIGVKSNDATENEELLNPQDDPLFEKYSRKTLGQRQYSTQMGNPNIDGSFEARVGAVTSDLTAFAGTWTAWEVGHLLRRLSFGVKKADMHSLLALSPSAAVDALFTFTPNPVSPSPTPLYFNTANLADTLGTGNGTGTPPGPPYVAGGVAQGADWTTSNILGYPPFGPQYSRRLSLAFWHWGVCLNEPASIREKMQQFWYHFIPTGFEELDNLAHNSATVAHDYMKLLRTTGLGNFKTLIKAISKSPAMLVYLSNQNSTATAPNENFARELLELFTMGKAPTQNYTEADVVAASKVFSGWRVNSFVTTYPVFSGFDASRHNQTNKQFSSNFGNTVINNVAGAGGAAEFDTFFNMLFTHQGTTIAKYICRRLYRFFVYYDIDPNIEQKIIEPLAALLISNDWEIAPTVKTLFKSQHFFDNANKAVMIKNPIDYLTGLMRTLNVNTNTALGVDKQYKIWGELQGFGENYLGQSFGAPPTVEGWKAYTVAPYYQIWINSETVQKRSKFITDLIYGYSIIYPDIILRPDFTALVKQLGEGPNAVNVSNPNILIDEVIKYLFSLDLSATYKAQVKQQELLLGQTTDSYWTNIWNAYITNPTTLNYNNVNNKLKGMFTALLQLAEFQLM
jgi:Protein of unknown function (DUF1800)